MPRKTAYRYQGILNKPMKPPFTVVAVRSAHAERFSALCRDCGTNVTDPNAYVHVALELAKRHVPGFRFEEATRPRRGPKLEWPRLVASFRLWHEMTQRIAKGMTIRTAAKHTARGGGLCRHRQLRLSRRQ
jgi:hypothetical protein